MVAFQHFRHPGHRRPEILHLPRLVHLETDLDEAEHVESDPLAVQNSHVLADIPQLLQPFDPRMHRRRRQIHPARQLHIADAAVSLERTEDRVIQLIEL